MKNAQEFVNVSEASADDESCFTAPGTDPQSLKQVLCEKTYDCAIAKTYVGGREQQMQAARTFRRVAETEALVEEGQRRMTMEVGVMVHLNHLLFLWAVLSPGVQVLLEWVIASLCSRSWIQDFAAEIKARSQMS